MTTLVHFLAVVAAVVTLWVVFYDFLPWVAKLIAIYGLHDLRDRLYDIGESSARLRDTLIYRDAEFLLCVAISVVRERDFRFAIGLAQSFARPRASGAQWRREQYSREIVTLGEEDTAYVGQLQELINLALRSRGLVMFRAIFGHPLPMFVGATAIGAAFASSVARKLIDHTTPLDQVGDAVSEVESEDTPQGSLLQLRQLLAA